MLVPRYLQISLPAVYLLLARAFMQSPVRPRLQALAATAFVCFGLVHLLWISHYYTKPHKEQYREAVQVVVNSDLPYREGFIIGYSWSAGVLNYYFARQGSPRRVDILAGQASDIKRVKRLLDAQQPRYIWFVRGSRRLEDAFLNFLYQNYRYREHRSFINADAWLFENPALAQPEPSSLPAQLPP
jgi:hypothetical protein